MPYYLYNLLIKNMKLINLFNFQTYLSDLTVFILCIVWRSGRQAILDTCKFVPIIINACTTNRPLLNFKCVLAELKRGATEHVLSAYKKFSFLDWTQKTRLRLRGREDDEEGVSKRVLPSFNLYEKTLSLFNKKFYQDLKGQTRFQVYKRMPWRMLSRLWGYVNSINLPCFLRSPIYHLYVWVFGCRLEEAITQELHLYRNLSEFFRRLLRPELRPIDQRACLTSPVDGEILYCGRVQRNMLEQVKGVTYSLQEFLGPFEASRFSVAERKEVMDDLSDDSGDDDEIVDVQMDDLSDNSDDSGDDDEIDDVQMDDEVEDDDDDDKKAIQVNFPEREDDDEEDAVRNVGVRVHRKRLPSKCYSMTNLQAEDPPSEPSHTPQLPSPSHSTSSLIDKEHSHLLENPTHNSLFYCVVYLAPGDYHRFHSSANWRVQYRRHFPGELFSVNPSVARWLKGLFNWNERVVYYGRWMHGFFSMTAVGATNVGSIAVYVDKNLKTNTRQKINQGRFFDKSFLQGDVTKTKKMMDADRELEVETGGGMKDGGMKNGGKEDGGVFMKKGKLFGEFNLGSTIVLLFEAPSNFQFKVEPGQKVKYGQPFV